MLLCKLPRCGFRLPAGRWRKGPRWATRGERELGPSHADHLCPAGRSLRKPEGHATQNVKDAYAGLKGLIQRRFHGRNEAEVALAQHQANPEVWAPVRGNPAASSEFDHRSADLRDAGRRSPSSQNTQPSLARADDTEARGEPQALLRPRDHKARKSAGMFEHDARRG
jgi:hypothetical protein